MINQSLIKQFLKLGTQTNIIDKKVLLYYETFDIIKYCKMIYVHGIPESLFIYSITKLNVMKLIVILLILL